MPGGQKRVTEEIQCIPAVTYQKINEYVEYCPLNCTKCRLLMQKVRVTVTRTGEKRRKNFKIMCYGPHISLCFWSGSCGNEVVVQVDDEDEIDLHKAKSAWREWFRKVWKRFKERFQARQGLEGEERTALEHSDQTTGS